jgi:NADPH:quinone reductase-like Zn-dependent oxidoreductase
MGGVSVEEVSNIVSAFFWNRILSKEREHWAMNVLGKTIVITGGAGGLGSAMAKLLAANGAVICIFDLDSKKGDEVVQERFCLPAERPASQKWTWSGKRIGRLL